MQPLKAGCIQHINFSSLQHSILQLLWVKVNREIGKDGGGGGFLVFKQHLNSESLI